MGRGTCRRGLPCMWSFFTHSDGFSVPIVCGCSGKIYTGCNLNLLDTCAPHVREDAGHCKNIYRDGEATPKQFTECAGMAYTFPGDHDALANGFAGCEHAATCCVGTACPPHHRQKLCPDGPGKRKACGGGGGGASSSPSSEAEVEDPWER
ncbi:hypothetical protein GGS20DRAFT_530149 [Poronia punctata]|nr:hypothetical protein GGS20DRAFT_530149 [Poronia punctata]